MSVNVAAFVDVDGMVDCGDDEKNGEPGAVVEFAVKLKQDAVEEEYCNVAVDVLLLVAVMAVEM